MNVWIASSSRVKSEKYLTLAREVANFLKEKNFHLACGGNSNSMMREIYQEFGTDSTIVTLACYNEDLDEVKHVYLEDTTFDRTKRLYEMADIILFLPGGTGTLAEIFASLEEHRTNLVNKKMILFNYDGFYDLVIEEIEKEIKEDMNEASIKDHFIVVDTLEELREKVSE